jgi:hypothetical protein
MSITIEKTLKDIAFALARVADALEEANKPKGLGSPRIPPNWGHGIADCVSKDEIPLPTPWNTDIKPSCNSDRL